VTFYEYVPVISAVLTLGIGGYVIFRDPGRLVNRLFFAITIFLAIWGIGEYVMRTAATSGIAFTGAKVAALGWCFLGGIYVHFTLALTGRDRALRNPWTYVGLYLPGVLFFVSVLSSRLVFHGFVPSPQGYREVGGPLRVLSLVYVVVFFLIGITILASCLRKTRSRETRIRLWCVIVATLLPLTLGLFTDVILPQTGHYLPVSSLAADPLMAMIIAYAVTRYDLMTRIAAAFPGTIISSIREAVLVADRTGAIETVNPAAVELTGYTEKELIGMKPENMFAGSPGETSGSDTHGEGDAARWNLLLSKGGQAIPVTRSAGVVRRPNGKEVGTVIVVHDMRDTMRLIQAEQEVLAAEEEAKAERYRATELRERTEFLQGIIENIVEPIFIKDRFGRFFYANRAYREFVGRPLEEIVGATEFELYPAEVADLFHETDIEVMTTGSLVEIEEEIEAADGSLHTMRALVAPIKDDSGSVDYTVGIISDITQLKQLEKARLDFVRIAAHELRTPLTSLKLGFELLARETRGTLDNDQQRSLDVLSLSIERLSMLAKNLLDLASVEAGMLSLDKRNMAVEPIMIEVMTMFEGQLRERGLDSAFECDERLYRVDADPGRVAQVLVNLMSNAIKFTDKGRITMSARNLDGAMVEVCVADTGIGIPAREYVSIFSRFSKIQGEKTAYEGSGLGLAISSAIIEAHGGGIRVESKVGEGSSFYFTIPASPG
jgi:PAS domain S-box-containing protein